jgi:hypothetical protein
MKKTLLASALLAGCGTAAAQSEFPTNPRSQTQTSVQRPTNPNSPATVPSSAAVAQVASIDLRAVGATLEIDDDVDKIETESSGFEIRGAVYFNSQFFGRVSYVTTESDEIEFNGVDVDGDIDLDITRAGLGVQGESGPVVLYGAIEYADVKLTLEDVEADDDGFILSGGIRDSGVGSFLWGAELGFVKLDEIDGAVFQFDIGYRFTPNVAILLGGQGYAMEDDFGGEYTVSHGTLGVRFSF